MHPEAGFYIETSHILENQQLSEYLLANQWHLSLILINLSTKTQLNPKAFYLHVPYSNNADVVIQRN